MADERILDARAEDFARFARTRDPRLRDQLVEAHLALSNGLAYRFARRGEPVEDLQQVAALALVNAVDRFDPDRDVTFPVFATRTILGELKRHFRDKGWAVRPPRRIQELCLELNKEVERLTQENGRSPTVPELAAACDATEEDVIEALDAADAYWATSLDLPVADGEPMGAHLGGPDPELVAAEHRATLEGALSRLAARERLIVYLRFTEGLTQAEIAIRLGLSQMHVSRLVRASLAELRDAYGAQLRLADIADLTD